MISPEDIEESQILVDTDVLSYIFRKDQKAEYFKPYLRNRTLAVSFMTVAELYYGAYKSGWQSARLESLENYLKNYTILPYDAELVRQWAKVRVECRTRGNDIGHSDAWIAATALRYGCALVTNNGRHFKGTSGLTVICPTLG
jgi:predicted nucleic acid-binding protein